MKRAGSFLVLCAILILSLTACGGGAADANTAARMRSVKDEGKSMMLEAKYFAAPSGRVQGIHKDSLRDEVRSTAGKMADGARRAGDTVGNALDKMAHN